MDHNPYLLTLPQLISARNKISRVAAFYDPLKTPLDAFHTEAMNPTEFREQLRRNFGIKFTDEELGAIIFLFDKDGDRMIDTVEFINEFFKLGKQEVARLREEKIKAEERIKKLHEKQQIQRENQTERLTMTKIADTFTPEEERSAVRKIAKVAFSYDRSKGGLDVRGTLPGFVDVVSLTPVEFKEQMRRNFGIVLTPGEAAAVTKIFDNDGDGTIDCKEFMYHFFRIRREEIDRHFSRQQTMTYKKNIAEQQRKAERFRKFEELVIAKMTEASEKERKATLRKIKRTATFYQPKAFSLSIDKIFECEIVSPTVFRELLKQNFGIKLSPGELYAAMELFDADGDGTISCVEFMTTFFRIGMEERSRILEHKRKRDRELQKIKEDAELELITSMQEKAKTNVVWPVLPTPGGIFSVDAQDHEDGSVASASANTLNSSATGATNSSKKSRKASMEDFLSPNKLLKQLGKSNESMTKLFPYTSEDTKQFLLELEAKEREIDGMSRSGSRLLTGRSNLSSAESSVQNSADDDNQSAYTNNSTSRRKGRQKPRELGLNGVKAKRKVKKTRSEDIEMERMNSNVSRLTLDSYDNEDVIYNSINSNDYDSRSQSYDQSFALSRQQDLNLESYDFQQSTPTNKRTNANADSISNNYASTHAGVDHNDLINTPNTTLTLPPITPSPRSVEQQKPKRLLTPKSAHNAPLSTNTDTKFSSKTSPNSSPKISPKSMEKMNQVESRIMSAKKNFFDNQDFEVDDYDDEFDTEYED